MLIKPFDLQFILNKLFAELSLTCLDSFLNFLLDSFSCAIKLGFIFLKLQSELVSFRSNTQIVLCHD